MSHNTGVRSKRLQIWAKTSGHCWYCGVEMQRHDPRKGARCTDFSVDHVQARSRVRDTQLYNLVPCCRSCNSQKQTRTLEEFRVFLAYKRSGIPKFTPEHLAYLRALNIQLPEGFPCLPHVTFWFEEEGLEL